MPGTRHDREVAEHVGISTASVTSRRVRMKIAPFRKRAGKNRPRKSINDWTRKETALLGKLTDQEVAEKLNLGHATVRLKRMSLGIPPCRSGSKRRAQRSPQVLERLGREADSAIAKDIEFTPQAVSPKRAALGIPPYQQKR